VVELTEPENCARLDTQQASNPLLITFDYTFMEAGKEVSHMIAFIAKDEQQYNQFNEQLHPSLP